MARGTAYLQTTLMDVLADRKTSGRYTGKVTVNGFDKKADSFARVMGYGEQFDFHSSGATVEEALHTSALLRLSREISNEQVRCAPSSCSLMLAIVRLEKGRAGLVKHTPLEQRALSVP